MEATFVNAAGAVVSRAARPLSTGSMTGDGAAAVFYKRLREGGGVPRFAASDFML
jgi:hypothetical protein